MRPRRLDFTLPNRREFQSAALKQAILPNLEYPLERKAGLPRKPEFAWKIHFGGFP
jgi:hypothetical protein